MFTRTLTLSWTFFRIFLSVCGFVWCQSRFCDPRICKLACESASLFYLPTNVRYLCWNARNLWGEITKPFHTKDKKLNFDQKDNDLSHLAVTNAKFAFSSHSFVSSVHRSIRLHIYRQPVNGCFYCDRHSVACNSRCKFHTVCELSIESSLKHFGNVRKQSIPCNRPISLRNRLSFGFICRSPPINSIILSPQNHIQLYTLRK